MAIELSEQQETLKNEYFNSPALKQNPLSYDLIFNSDLLYYFPINGKKSLAKSKKI
jgi:hypothetical protein